MDEKNQYNNLINAILDTAQAIVNQWGNNLKTPQGNITYRTHGTHVRKLFLSHDTTSMQIRMDNGRGGILTRSGTSAGNISDAKWAASQIEAIYQYLNSKNFADKITESTKKLKALS